MNIPDYVINPDPDFYLKDNYIVLDWETTNLENGDPINEDNYIVCGVWKWGNRSPNFTGRLQHFTNRGNGNGGARELFDAIGEADFIVAHNAKFELQWLCRLFGRELLRNIRVWCTQIGEYTLRQNKQYIRVGLDATLERRGLGNKKKLVSLMIGSGTCPSEIPMDWLLSYCEEDVTRTEMLFEVQRPEIYAKGLHKVMYTRLLQTPVIADIEFNGLCLDKDKVEEKYQQVSKELHKVEMELNEFAEGINWNSGTQVADFLYNKLKFKEITDRSGKPIRNKATKQWPDGLPKTDKDTMAALKATTKKQEQFLEIKARYGKYHHQVTKYLDKFRECCEADNGILHASINQTVTATGRYSSTGKRYKTQIQNLDRSFKPMFRARRPGWRIGEADEAQLEFRAGVWFGQDPQGFRDIETGADVHQFTADTIFGQYSGEGKHPRRTDAKAHTFKPLYGGISGTDAEKRYYKAFRRKYQGITDVQDRWVQEALRDKQRTLATGITFYYPNVKMSKSGYVEGNTNVRNYPVQYLATAEIVPIALVYFWYALSSHNAESFIVNTVHDSIICEVHPDENELFVDLSVKALEEFPIEYMKKLYDIDFNVPLEAECELNEYWGEA